MTVLGLSPIALFGVVVVGSLFVLFVLLKLEDRRQAKQATADHERTRQVVRAQRAVYSDLLNHSRTRNEVA